MWNFKCFKAQCMICHNCPIFDCLVIWQWKYRQEACQGTVNIFLWSYWFYCWSCSKATKQRRKCDQHFALMWRMYLKIFVSAMESGISKLNIFNLCTLIITEWNWANYCSQQLVVCWFWPDLLAMHFIAFFGLFFVSFWGLACSNSCPLPHVSRIVYKMILSVVNDCCRI